MVVFLLLFVYWQFGPNFWPLIRISDQAQLAPNWSRPIRVGLNTSNWEGGAYISSDGTALYYAYYPGDLEREARLGRLPSDIDVYYSLKPFAKAKKHPLSEDAWSEGGVMLAGSDIYYMSDRYSPGTENLYKNGKLIAIGNFTESQKNPHYCALKAELYFEMAGIIYIYKAGLVKNLTWPINDGNQNIQPFLTPDCQKMYFSSNRGNGVFKILESERINEDSWSQPKVVVASQHGVGEPTLTDDGRTLFFVQTFKSLRGNMNSDIFYINEDKK